MDLQKNTLKEYLDLKNSPSIRQIAEDTKIQQTRVFRLLNGSKMKLEEYEIFKERIIEARSSGSELEKLSFECVSKLSKSALKELEETMREKLNLWSMIYSA